ncbi:IS66 family transposase [Nannocystaceae bacterium ST9]
MTRDRKSLFRRSVTELAELVARLDQLEANYAKATSEREHYRRLYLDMLEQCKKLERGLLGQKAERLPAADGQLTLELLGSLLEASATSATAAMNSSETTDVDADPDANTEVRASTRRRKAGRGRLPEHMPRVDIELIPEEVQREGLDAFERLPGEVSEILERRRASLVVLHVHRPRFLRKDRERNVETKFHVAEPLDLPIERGLAGPGLLADTLVKRFQDHLPLNRLETIYEREGVHLARSTLCGWHRELAELVEPLVAGMWRDAKTAPYLCTDATGVLVQAKDRCRRGHFWVVVAPARHVLYGYSARHDSAAVDRLFADYQGYLVADAHAVYDHLYEDGTILEVGCWAHARRYFFKALVSEPQHAREALAFITALFRLERELAGQSAKHRKAARQTRAKPVVDAFFEWCERKVDHVLDDTPIAKGLGYVRNQREALQRFLLDGRLPLHNNISELHLRRQAVGRKNWLFVGNDDAGEVNATIVSLLASCDMHGVEPVGYLRDLLCLLPYWRQHRVLELAPVNWRQTLEQPEARELLAENVCRRAALGELDHLVEG